VVDGIDNTTAWCLWWRVCADRASPVCVVEKERKKEASESGQRLRRELGLKAGGALCLFIAANLINLERVPSYKLTCYPLPTPCSFRIDLEKPAAHVTLIVSINIPGRCERLSRYGLVPQGPAGPASLKEPAAQGLAWPPPASQASLALAARARLAASPR
jgi:hypothetical protein